MYRIGICDNAESVCVSLKEMILQFAHANHVQMETMLWHTGEELYIGKFLLCAGIVPDTASELPDKANCAGVDGQLPES